VQGASLPGDYVALAWLNRHVLTPGFDGVVSYENGGLAYEKREKRGSDPKNARRKSQLTVLKLRASTIYRDLGLSKRRPQPPRILRAWQDFPRKINDKAQLKASARRLGLY